MVSLLIVVWLFLMVAFCALGGACALSGRLRPPEDRERTGRGLAAGADGERYPGRGDRRPGLATGESARRPRGSERIAARDASPVERFAGTVAEREASLRDLQRRFVDGWLSVEQYEREVERLLGLAS